MAPRRRKKRQSKSKLFLLLLPLAALLAIVAWLFLDEAKRFLDFVPTREGPAKPASSKQPRPPSPERILDRERKKLDEILENR